MIIANPSSGSIPTGTAIAIGMYSTAVINHECAEQIYARSGWSKIKDRKKSNFEVEIIDKKIERN